MLKNKLIKSVCLLDRFNHFNIFFFSSPNKIWKIKFLKYSTFKIQIPFYNASVEYNPISTPCTPEYELTYMDFGAFCTLAPKRNLNRKKTDSRFHAHIPPPTCNVS